MADLLEVVSDFPFQSPAHQSIWLACVLTSVARPAINGACPLTVIDANTRGAGKTLLADTIGIIAYGTSIARMAWSRAEEELNKTITSVALEGCPIILFDNIASGLGGTSLDAALTGTAWKGRVLGESRMTGAMPLTTLWMATGNNVDFIGDTHRRALVARLVSLDENLEDRTGFRHKNLLAWVRSNRSRLAAAALIVLRAYITAGRPDMQLPPCGSFESWSDLIRNPIVFAGEADPWHGRDNARDTDRSKEQLQLLHAGIEEADVDGDGLTAADIVRLLSNPIALDRSDEWPTLRAAVTELCGSKINGQSIGYGLRGYYGRNCGGKQLVNRNGHGGVKRWFVESISPNVISGGDGGDGGDESGRRELETVEEPVGPVPSASVAADNDVEVF